MEASDSSSTVDKKRRKEKSSRSKKRDERKPRKRRRSNSTSSSDDDDDDDSYRRERDKKDRKKRKKEKKKKMKKEKKKASRDKDDSSCQSADPLERNYDLADALLNMLEGHPALAEDFPIMLIRLASGTTFDLSQMSDRDAASCLSNVFSKLQPFGVAKNRDGAWCWEGGSRSSNPSHNEQIVLVKLVRTMLDQIGFTMEAIEHQENPNLATVVQNVEANGDKAEEIAYKTAETLREFKPELAQELASLCRMILDGESIAVDGLEDERLRNALETIFRECKLEKLEMENEEEDGDDGSVAFGYSLPPIGNEEAQQRLMRVMQTCEETLKKPPVKGPLKPPSSFASQMDASYEESESSDEEGPAMIGSGHQKKGLSKDLVAAQAEARSRQLANAKQGIASSIAEALEGQSREEWMVVPGKQFDFLSSVKSGKPMTNRKFGAQSKADLAKPEASIHPSIQAEIKAIKEAHDESRGPSLMEQHREKKLQEQAAAAASGKSESWKWNRDKDLDSGRRVDKDALGMILGSAGNELKSKFHGGFG